MVNSLTREASVRFGPLLLETLIKHYFDRIVRDSASQGKDLTQLRKDELLYDEAFIIVKMFLEAASKHTVEELQKFSNTRTPSPPWVLVVKILVPMSCCDDAAKFVIQALGGEEMTKKIVGGTKWWQVRGPKGVDAEWIAAKKDWQDAKKRYKMQEKSRSSLGTNGHGHKGKTMNTDSTTTGVQDDAPPCYQPEMDEMRCILYAHGGGYYFGSVDQERYALQRFARKINGRVFAMNYRLAPQYPFPCALQDLIASYLFLIRPPEGASHLPVNPAHIVVAGDSAGGGLTIALLQVLRDCGLPMPAGAVLISPWCDLTHSFPSIHTNTATDVIPPYGLSFNKPSTLWPPPPDELNVKMRETLRSRIQQAVSLSTRTPAQDESRSITPQDGTHDVRLPQTGQTLHLGSTASLPTLHAGAKDQSVSCRTMSGKTLTIHEQIHLYAPNYLLCHPLISPVLSYLGGLPPLFVMAGNGEVLRDEIIYMAHKAANPDKFPLKADIREMYPALKGIEDRFGPTKVHLQVYDDAAHILPILFSFTTPAKYCFRAMATFIRYATGMLPLPHSSLPNIPLTLSPPNSPGLVANDGLSLSPVSSQSPSRRSSFLRPKSSAGPSRNVSRDPSPRPRGGSLFTTGSKKVADEEAENTSSKVMRRQSFRQTIGSHISKAGILFKGGQNTPPQIRRSSPEQSGSSSFDSQDESRSGQQNSVDVAGPRFYGSGIQEAEDAVRKAGEASVYKNGLTTMLRERVSTHGVTSPLESEDELAAFSLPPELVGVISELAMRRYIDAKAKFDKKFSGTYKTIEKQRHKNLEFAKKHATRNMMQLQSYMAQDDRQDTIKGVKEGLVASGSWSWAWALDMDEKPPPSSIVARRDTQEAVKLARIADQSVLAEENVISGNNLWSLMVNFLTATPDKKQHHRKEEKQSGEDNESRRERIRSKLAQLVSDGKKQRKDTPREA